MKIKGAGRSGVVRSRGSGALLAPANVDPMVTARVNDRGLPTPFLALLAAAMRGVVLLVGLEDAVARLACFRTPRL